MRIVSPAARARGPAKQNKPFLSEKRVGAAGLFLLWVMYRGRTKIQIHTFQEAVHVSLCAEQRGVSYLSEIIFTLFCYPWCHTARCVGMAENRAADNAYFTSGLSCVWLAQFHNPDIPEQESGIFQNHPVQQNNKENSA